MRDKINKLEEIKGAEVACVNIEWWYPQLLEKSEKTAVCIFCLY